MASPWVGLLALLQLAFCLSVFADGLSGDFSGVLAEGEGAPSNCSTNLVQVKASLLRPKNQWEEPLSAEEVAEFEKDMDMPIVDWIAANPTLTSDYFVKFGVGRGYAELAFWNGVHQQTDYVQSGLTGATLWKGQLGWMGQDKGLLVTLDIEGEQISTRLDHPSYIADDPYCFTFGWLKGQGLDGSLLSNKTAWDEVTSRECEKIQAIEQFPKELHTVRRHVLFNRVWPERCACNVVDGGERKLTSMLIHGLAKTAGDACTKATKRDFREHVYRKCLFGFAPTEMAYCYERGCLMEGNRIGHGPACP